MSSAAPRSLLPWLRWSPSLAWGVVVAVLFFAVLANIGSPEPFLYFQF